MTPLVVFAFNRLDKLDRVLQAVWHQTARPQKIIAFCDAQRSDSDAPKCQAVRRLLRGYGAEVHVRERNYGCAANIMHGVNEVAGQHESFVVLEDDTLPAPYWYAGMLALLEKYGGEEKVGGVGAFPSVLNGSLLSYPYDVLFSPRFSCWGWGSWRSRWSTIFKEWNDYCHQGPPFDPAYLPGHAGGDISGMLQNHPRGSLWDAMMAGTFLHHNWLQAIPSYYLVYNIGADVHLGQDKIDFMWRNNPIQDKLPSRFPPAVEMREDVCQAVRDYVRAMGC